MRLPVWLCSNLRLLRPPFSGEKPKPILTRPEAGILLQNAGFTKMDFDRLNNFASLSNDVSCQMELKIDTIVEILPPEKRGPFARFIVAQ